ncbi:hypothetical protein ACFFR3_46470 [Nonomuraea salmonea]|uniref:Uncharacterized protein n=2 Tax=Nonomuraea salmonea TaxID=46181 RepID=A0ABV5P326_9ACTN
MMDVVAYPLAAKLLECLCAELEASLAGPVCRCCVVPGAGYPPMDGCMCECGGGQGQAWTRVSRMFPTSQRFPAPLQEAPPTCFLPGSWAVELEAGVYRCAATMAEDGTPPSCEEVDRDARVVLDDAAAIRRAVMCCFAAQSRVVVPGQWQAIGPSGGCQGGVMTLLVQAYDCCPT